MDGARNFLSVTIPVHPHFLDEGAGNAKTEKYEKRVLEALGCAAMSKNQLASAMGYKGITSKLAKTVDKLVAENALEKVPSGSQVKFRAAGRDGSLAV